MARSEVVSLGDARARGPSALPGEPGRVRGLVLNRRGLPRLPAMAALARRVPVPRVRRAGLGARQRAPRVCRVPPAHEPHRGDHLRRHAPAPHLVVPRRLALLYEQGRRFGERAKTPARSAQLPDRLDNAHQVPRGNCPPGPHPPFGRGRGGRDPLRGSHSGTSWSCPGRESPDRDSR